MRRFYVNPDNICDTHITINGSEARHITSVLRLQAGERIVIFDGSGYDYEVLLLSVTSAVVTGEVLSQSLAITEPPVVITLVQGLAKGEKMDFIIQKSVELGVDRIIPIQTDHSVVKVENERASGKILRWNRMAGALDMKRRAWLPEVD
jgi:16S rRNA (uracil1498-N3)-methyltransferase